MPESADHGGSWGILATEFDANHRDVGVGAKDCLYDAVDSCWNSVALNGSWSSAGDRCSRPPSRPAGPPVAGDR
jgi:hypothetical protein